MIKIIKNRLCLIVLLWVVGIAHAETYEVTFKGKKAGRAELSIEENSLSYRVNLALYPITMVKFFGLDDMIESAQGNIEEGQFVPHAYRRTDSDGKTLLNVAFLDGNVKVTDAEKGEKQFDIPAAGQDPLSQIAQIQHDLRQGILKSAYILVTENNQRTYFTEQAGQQVILTEQPSKRRQIHLWFDETITLTKMDKRKGGKVQFSMQKINQ